MKTLGFHSLAFAVLASVYGASASLPQEQRPTVEIPKPGVSQIMTIEG